MKTYFNTEIYLSNWTQVKVNQIALITESTKHSKRWSSKSSSTKYFILLTLCYKCFGFKIWYYNIYWHHDSRLWKEHNPCFQLLELCIVVYWDSQNFVLTCMGEKIGEIKSPAPKLPVIIFSSMSNRINSLISFQHISAKVFGSNIYLTHFRLPQ